MPEIVASCRWMDDPMKNSNDDGILYKSPRQWDPTAGEARGASTLATQRKPGWPRDTSTYRQLTAGFPHVLVDEFVLPAVDEDTLEILPQGKYAYKEYKE